MSETPVRSWWRRSPIADPGWMSSSWGTVTVAVVGEIGDELSDTMIVSRIAASPRFVGAGTATTAINDHLPSRRAI